MQNNPLELLTPISSTIILSRPLGPKELLTTFAMACVANTILSSASQYAQHFVHECLCAPF